MLRSKTITSKVFPLLEGLPEKVTEGIKARGNDRAFLFEPPTAVTDTESKYYCLSCGRHGKTTEGEPVCPHCGNRNSRPFRKDGYRHNAQIYRYIHSVENGYLFIRDFECDVAEDYENGLAIEQREMSRLCIKDGEMLAFLSHSKYNGGQVETCWKKEDHFYYWSANVVHLICTDETKRDPILTKLEQSLTLPVQKLYEDLKLAVAGSESKTPNVMPEVHFSSENYPTEPIAPRWTARSIDMPAENTDRFVFRHSWCTNCGEYRRKLIDRDRYYSSVDSFCLMCGNSKHNPHDPYVLTDAECLSDGSVVLRVTCGEKINDFAAPTVIGEHPAVKTSYNTIFTNYIVISPNGEVSFFNEERENIEQLQVQPHPGRRFVKEFFYTEEAGEIIRTNAAIARTGFNCYFEKNSMASPKYFEYLKQLPCLEIFAKFGFNQLVDDILAKPITDLPAYFRKEFRESRFSKLTKPQIKSMKESIVTLKVLIAYMQVLNKDGEALYGDLYALATHAHERHVLDILRVGIPGMSVSRIAEYIRNVDDFQCCPPNESMQLWSDYLRMLRDSECDLTDRKLVFTNSLKREHDKMSRKITQIRNEKLSEDFTRRAADNEWLEYKGTKLSAIIPKELSEIYEEGRKLNHCVGGYAKRIVDGETVIAFLRENDHVERPYCTVEIRDHRIVQARGFSNREGRYIPGVSEFLKTWAKEKNLTVDVA